VVDLAIVLLVKLRSMNPTITSEGPLPEPTPTKASLGVWRIVGYIVGFQVLIVLIGAALFSVVGLANDGPTGCGGG
jgi:hypothetical protein